MAGISVQCTGTDAARVDRFQSGSNDSVYLSIGVGLGPLIGIQKGPL